MYYVYTCAYLNSMKELFSLDWFLDQQASQHNKRVTLYCIQLLVRLVQEEYRINCTHQTGWVGGRLLFLPIIGPIFDILSQCHTCWGPYHPPYLACFVSAKVMSHCAPSLTGAIQKLLCLAHGTKTQLSCLYPKESNNASTPFAAILKTRK